MKRSQINRFIREAVVFLGNRRFHLPPWAYWKPGDWKGRYESCREIVDNGLGWDLTDFGSGDFEKSGLLLFTIRNGNPSTGEGKPYAEKAMVVRENQETPMHFHWSKMEDIINRGGGNLVIELYGSTPEEGLDNSPITVSLDGIMRTVKAGDRLVLTPGESISLEQGVYHRFFAEPGHGTVLIGEVSCVNDDTRDNRFLEPEKIGRFPEIEEDEEPLHLLIGDYFRYL